MNPNEILQYAFEVIEAASSLIPCRIALVECSEEIYRRKLYDNCGFVFLQQDRDFYQYYKLGAVFVGACFCYRHKEYLKYIPVQYIINTSVLREVYV